MSGRQRLAGIAFAFAVSIAIWAGLAWLVAQVVHRESWIGPEQLPPRDAR